MEAEGGVDPNIPPGLLIKCLDTIIGESTFYRYVLSVTRWDKRYPFSMLLKEVIALLSIRKDLNRQRKLDIGSVHRYILDNKILDLQKETIIKTPVGNNSINVPQILDIIRYCKDIHGINHTYRLYVFMALDKENDYRPEYDISHSPLNLVYIVGMNTITKENKEVARVYIATEYQRIPENPNMAATRLLIGSCLEMFADIYITADRILTPVCTVVHGTPGSPVIDPKAYGTDWTVTTETLNRLIAYFGRAHFYMNTGESIAQSNMGVPQAQPQAQAKLQAQLQAQAQVQMQAQQAQMQAQAKQAQQVQQAQQAQQAQMQVQQAQTQQAQAQQVQVQQMQTQTQQMQTQMQAQQVQVQQASTTSPSTGTTSDVDIFGL